MEQLIEDVGQVKWLSCDLIIENWDIAINDSQKYITIGEPNLFLR